MDNSTKKIDKNYQWFYFPCDEILKRPFNPVIYFLKRYFNQNEDNNKKSNKDNFDKKYNNLIVKTNNKELKIELIRVKSIIGHLINIYFHNSLFDKLDAKARYDNILYGMKSLIKAESLINPVIIELEDGHNIDSDTKRWLEVLTRNVENFPFLIISTCRYNNDGSEFFFNLKKTIERRVAITHLNKDQNKILIQALLKELIPENTCKFIWNFSEGNPFYTEQTILYLKDNKIFDDNFDLRERTFEIPSDINSLIIARVDSLSLELKKVVQTASVIGRKFSIRILDNILNQQYIDRYLIEGERESIFSILSNLIYIFKSPIIRESIYQMQLKERLRFLHKLTAETIESLYKDEIETHYSELVNHYEKADIKKKTIQYLQKAAKYSKDNFFNKQALYYYDKLLINYKWIENETFIKSIKVSGIEKYSKDFQNYIDIIFDRCEILDITGKWNEVINHLDKVLQIAEKIKDIKRIIRGNNLYGKTLLYFAEYQKADEKFRKCLDLADKYNYINTKIVAIYNLGNIFFRKSDFRNAKKNYEESLRLSKIINDKSKIAQCIGNLGVMYENMQNFEKAEIYYKDAIKTFSKTGEKRAVAIYNGNLGNVYFFQNKYKTAMKYYKKNLSFREKIGDKSGISNVSNNIGNLYKDSGFLNKAVKWIEKSIKISIEIGDIRNLSLSYAYLQGVYQNFKQYNKSLLCLDKAIKLFKKANNIVFIAIGYCAKGNIYKDLKEYDLAKSFYNKSISLHKDLKSYYYLCNCLIDKANLLFFLKEFKEAKKITREANEISKKLKRNDTILITAILLKKIDFITTPNVKLRKSYIYEIFNLSNIHTTTEDFALINFEIFNLLILN